MSQRSSTSSSTNVILKYSRAYLSQTSNDWQHFTNPVIRVHLDVKKSLTTEELESVRLRVLWTIESGTDTMDIDQRDFVFEDIDLLSYSFVSAASFQLQMNQSPPVKAVFRDCVVGIRYQYPRVPPPGSAPSYRRFQMTFTSTAAASQFVDTISPVCPCKPNQPASGNIPASRQATISVISSTQHLTMPAPRAIPPPESSATKLSRTFTAAPPRQTTDPRYVAPSSSFGFPANPLDDAPMDTSSSTLGSSSHDVPSSSLPESAMPPPSVRPRQPKIPVASAEPQETDKADFIESLRKSSSLHDLSRSELEEVVSQVVREEGFTKLLESLDSMWRVKGYLGR